MNVFVTGVTGYIGGTVAVRLLQAGHRVTGLARDRDKAAALAGLGIAPVLGGLDDAELLTREARSADAVVNAASSDHAGAVAALVEGLAGSGKPLLHTSGSSIVADDAQGEPSELVFTEDTMPDPVPARRARVAIDRAVMAAAGRGIRSAVLCNTLIYGRGQGLQPDSIQLPALAGQARRSGIVRHVGRGLNVWSTVHIEDVADLYLRALEAAPAGSFFFAENGEASFLDMTRAIGRALGLGEPQSWSVEDAGREWGLERARFSLGSNSRVSAGRARAMLGWTPRHTSVVDWIATHMGTPPPA